MLVKLFKAPSNPANCDTVHTPALRSPTSKAGRYVWPANFDVSWLVFERHAGLFNTAPTNTTPRHASDTHVERLAYLAHVFPGQAVVVPVETAVPEVAGSNIQ